MIAFLTYACTCPLVRHSHFVTVEACTYAHLRDVLDRRAASVQHLDVYPLAATRDTPAEPSAQPQQPPRSAEHGGAS